MIVFMWIMLTIWGLVIFIAAANYQIIFGVYNDPKCSAWHVPKRRSARKFLMVALALPVIAPRAIVEGFTKAFSEAHRIKFFDDDDDDDG